MADVDPLTRGGQPAIFATRQAAQRIADLHGREGYPHQDRIDDGYTWPVDPGAQELIRPRPIAKPD